MQYFVLVYKDRDGVIKRLTSRSNHQRQTIAKKFNIRYKQVRIYPVLIDLLGLEQVRVEITVRYMNYMVKVYFQPYCISIVLLLLL
jgi:hypothetical protein